MNRAPKHSPRLLGFTLVELLAVLGIFAFITAAVAVAYPSAAVRLRVSNIASNLRGDLRQAQLSASSVSSQQQTVAGYGIVFPSGVRNSYQLFADKVTTTQVNGLYVGNKKYDGINENTGQPVALADSFAITDVCVSAVSTSRPFSTCRSNGYVGELAILFVRPSAQPIIYINSVPTTSYAAACIQVEYGKVKKGSGLIRNIIITRSGLISVSNDGCHPDQITTPTAPAMSVRSIAATTYGTSGTDLAVDAYGNTFIVSSSNNTVTKVTPDESISLYATLPFASTALGVDTYGTLYSHELDGGLQSIVTKIVPGSPPLLTTLPLLSPRPSSPVGFAVDQYGYVYQGEGGAKLWTMDPITGVRTSFTIPHTPLAVVTDLSGNIYTANSNHTVTKVNAAGTILWTASVGFNPKSLAVDAEGTVYTANYGENTVSKITAGGDATASFATVGTGPIDIATDALGNVYTVNGTAGTVTKITKTGTVTTLLPVDSLAGSPTAVSTLGTTVYVLYGNTNTLKKVIQ